MFKGIHASRGPGSSSSSVQRGTKRTLEPLQRLSIPASREGPVVQSAVNKLRARTGGPSDNPWNIPLNHQELGKARPSLAVPSCGSFFRAMFGKVFGATRLWTRRAAKDTLVQERNNREWLQFVPSINSISSCRVVAWCARRLFLIAWLDEVGRNELCRILRILLLE